MIMYNKYKISVFSGNPRFARAKKEGFAFAPRRAEGAILQLVIRAFHGRARAIVHSACGNIYLSSRSRIIYVWYFVAAFSLCIQSNQLDACLTFIMGWSSSPSFVRRTCFVRGVAFCPRFIFSHFAIFSCSILIIFSRSFGWLVE